MVNVVYSNSHPSQNATKTTDTIIPYTAQTKNKEHEEKALKLNVKNRQQR